MKPESGGGLPFGFGFFLGGILGLFLDILPFFSALVADPWLGSVPNAAEDGDVLAAPGDLLVVGELAGAVVDGTEEGEEGAGVPETI